MAEQIVVRCDGCHEGCHPLPMDIALLQEMAEKNSDLVKQIVAFKVMVGYCHQNEQSFYIEV